MTIAPTDTLDDAQAAHDEMSQAIYRAAHPQRLPLSATQAEDPQDCDELAQPDRRIQIGPLDI